MNVFDSVARELFGDEDQRGTFGPDFASTYTEYEGDPMTVGQLRRIQETDPWRSGNTNGFRNHEDYDYMYECLEDVISEWPNVNILMHGMLGTPDEWWAETVYIFYENVKDKDAFEEWAVLSFKSTLRSPTRGVSPSDPRVNFGNECFRYPRSDEHLMATTDEFDFREHEKHGEYVRLWWDD